MSQELIRVRVLYLEPGNLVHLSEFDESINEFSVKEGRAMYGEDIADMNVYKICSSELAGGLRVANYGPGQMEIGEMVSSPSDPVVEMLVPAWIMYFDLLALDSDWAGSGGIGWTIESIGVWDTFHEHADILLEHAKTLREKKRPTWNEKTSQRETEWGEKVQFLTMWEFNSWSDYWGEWDCDHDLLGLVTDFTVAKFAKPISSKG